MTTLAVELATTDEALRALAADWDELWHSIPAAAPFQSPAWMLPWWEQFGTGQPIAAALRADDGRLLGLLPLYALDEPAVRSGGQAERKLLPIGAGTTDYLDALLHPLAPHDAAEHLLEQALHQAGSGITACDLVGLPPASPLLAANPPPGWREKSVWFEPGAALALPPGTTDLADIVPARKLRDLRLARHRAGRMGGWTSEVAGNGSIQRLLAALMHLHQDRWTAADEAGVFADPRVATFHLATAPKLVASGMLQLWALRLGGRVAAAYYALAAGGVGPGARMLFYLSGYDRGWGMLSPGTLLLGDVLEEGLRRGWRELDFLRGGEVFKSRWGAAERSIASRRLVPI